MGIKTIEKIRREKIVARVLIMEAPNCEQYSNVFLMGDNQVLVLDRMRLRWLGRVERKTAEDV